MTELLTFAATQALGALGFWLILRHAPTPKHHTNPRKDNQ
jgi:hypothetical protein